MQESEQAPQSNISKMTEKVKNVCTDRLQLIANIIACAILLLGAIIRLIFSFQYGYFRVLFFFLTLFYLSFIVLLGLSLLPSQNKVSIFVRTYFNFLDNCCGKGLFILFLSMIMVEQAEWYLIIMTIITCFIAVIDLIIGCKEAKEGLPSLPWSQNEEESKKADPESKRAKSYVISDGNPN